MAAIVPLAVRCLAFHRADAITKASTAAARQREQLPRRQLDLCTSLLPSL